MNFRPIEDWILVKPYPDGPKEQITESGLVVPIAATQKIEVKRALVVQISEDVDKTEIGYDVNDVILYYGKTGIPLYDNGEEYAFLKYDGMLAIENRKPLPLNGGEDYTSAKRD